MFLLSFPLLCNIHILSHSLFIVNIKIKHTIGSTNNKTITFQKCSLLNVLTLVCASDTDVVNIILLVRGFISIIASILFFYRICHHRLCAHSEITFTCLSQKIHRKFNFSTIIWHWYHSILKMFNRCLSRIIIRRKKKRQTNIISAQNDCKNIIKKKFILLNVRRWLNANINFKYGITRTCVLYVYICAQARFEKVVQ